MAIPIQHAAWSTACADQIPASVAHANGDSTLNPRINIVAGSLHIENILAVSRAQRVVLFF